MNRVSAAIRMRHIALCPIAIAGRARVIVPTFGRPRDFHHAWIEEGNTMDEVLINTTTAGDQSQPSVCGLQGTQFVVVWEDHSDNTIKGQMFGAGGTRSSNQILINLPTPPGPKRLLPVTVEYGSGFVVAW